VGVIVRWAPSRLWGCVFSRIGTVPSLTPACKGAHVRTAATIAHNRAREVSAIVPLATAPPQKVARNDELAAGGQWILSSGVVMRKDDGEAQTLPAQESWQQKWRESILKFLEAQPPSGSSTCCARCLTHMRSPDACTRGISNPRIQPYFHSCLAPLRLGRETGGACRLPPLKDWLRRRGGNAPSPWKYARLAVARTDKARRMLEKTFCSLYGGSELLWTCIEAC
jgi:hypothetical protein